MQIQLVDHLCETPPHIFPAFLAVLELSPDQLNKPECSCSVWFHGLSQTAAGNSKC